MAIAAARCARACSRWPVRRQSFPRPKWPRATLETGRVTLFRRTLGRVWVKGEDDGHYVDATEILVDCDDDTVIVKSRPTGNLCGHGYPGCFIYAARPAP